MPIKLKNPFIKRIAVVDSGDNPEADIVLFKAASKENDIEKGGDKNMVKTFDEIIKGLPEDEAKIVTDEIDKAAKKEMTPEEKAKLIADMKLEPAVKKEDKVTEAISKADPLVAEVISKMQEEITKTKEEFKKQEETLKKERLTKQVSSYDKIATPATELVDLFMKQEPEDAVKLDAILKAINTQLSDGTIFKTVGQNTGTENESALDKATKLAKARAAEKGISEPIAFGEILKENPELYKEYSKEV
jgi:hypothetical protein